MNAEQYRALVNKLEQIQQLDELAAPIGKDGKPMQEVPMDGAPAAAPAATPAPAAAPATSAATGVGNPGEEAAAQANPAPAKSQQNYNMALQQIKSLYAKAQVAYPPQDDIIRQRFGLPPALPPFEQWDGKMPEAGEADFLTRNVFGRQASKDVATQNAANKLSAAGAGRADATVAAKVKELNALVAKLGGGAPAAAPAPAAAAAPAPAAQSGQAAPASTQSPEEQAHAKSLGDFTGESTDLKTQLAKMLKESFNIELPEENDSFDSFGTPVPKGSAQATTADAPPAAKGADPELIKQIEAVMAEINGNMDENNPDPDATAALQAAQAALDKAKAAPAAAPAANPEDPSSAGAVNGMDKASDDAAAANAAKPAAPANQTFGQAFKAARASGAKEFEYKGKKYSTAIKGENPALDAAMAGKKPAAPTTPATPAKPTAPAQSGQATPAAPMKKELPPGMGTPSGLPLGTASKPPAPVMDPSKPGFDFKKASAAATATKESVGYNEDQTLARIVSLANIGR